MSDRRSANPSRRAAPSPNFPDFLSSRPPGRGTCRRVRLARPAAEATATAAAATAVAESLECRRLLTAVTLTGTAGNDTLVVTATSATSASVSLNGGPAVRYSNVTSFSFTGGAGD